MFQKSTLDELMSYMKIVTMDQERGIQDWVKLLEFQKISNLSPQSSLSNTCFQMKVYANEFCHLTLLKNI